MQSDLARSLQYMCDQEKAQSGKGRLAGLQAARDAFYTGDIAATIARFHKENGGWLTMDDLAGFEVDVEPPVSVRYKDYTVYTCRPGARGRSLGAGAASSSRGSTSRRSATTRPSTRTSWSRP